MGQPSDLNLIAFSEALLVILMIAMFVTCTVGTAYNLKKSTQ